MNYDVECVSSPDETGTFVRVTPYNYWGNKYLPTYSFMSLSTSTFPWMRQADAAETYAFFIGCQAWMPVTAHFSYGFANKYSDNFDGTDEDEFGGSSTLDVTWIPDNHELSYPVGYFDRYRNMIPYAIHWQDQLLVIWNSHDLSRNDTRVISRFFGSFSWNKPYHWRLITYQVQSGHTSDWFTKYIDYGFAIILR